jgi:trk system potassium uptake protein TrkH
MVGMQAAFREIFTIIHPRAVAAIRMNRTVVPEAVVRDSIGVAFLFIIGFLVTALVLAMAGVDLVSAVSASAACIGNVGPGLATVGPMADYHLIPAGGKWLLSVAMLAGRLEMYTVLILLSPHFWRR